MEAKYYNDKKSFNHKRYSNQTTLSSYVWYLKETLDVTPNLKWNAVMRISNFWKTLELMAKGNQKFSLKEKL